MIKKPVALIALCSSGLLAAPLPAMACPADLQAIGAQITTPELQPLLAEKFDDVIARSGSLDQALAKTNENLESAKAQRALIVDGSSTAAHQFDELITVWNAAIAALTCRKSP